LIISVKTTVCDKKSLNELFYEQGRLIKPAVPSAVSYPSMRHR
jgi:hypothetical protein